MARFPFFGFPYHYPYYNRYYNNYNYYKSETKKDDNNEADKDDMEIEESSVQAMEDNNFNRYNTKISSRNNNLLPFSLNFTGFSDCDEPIIEILGIKLFLDDIIILGLLFILYKEEVKDEMLFISLILLLLS